MKIALLSEEPQNLQRVFPEELREGLAALGELYGPQIRKIGLYLLRRERRHPPGGKNRFTVTCKALMLLQRSF